MTPVVLHRAQVSQSLAGSKQELAEQLQAVLVEKAQLDSSSRALQQQLDRTRQELDTLRSEHSFKVGAAASCSPAAASPPCCACCLSALHAQCARALVQWV